jgi:hypothetical protein
MSAGIQLYLTVHHSSLIIHRLSKDHLRCLSGHHYIEVAGTRQARDGGEGGHLKSRLGAFARAPAKGPAPSYAPHEGGAPPSAPPFKSHPLHLLPSCFRRSSLSTHRSSFSWWRRGWDLNPRSRFQDACFPSTSIRPLSHLSTDVFSYTLKGCILTLQSCGRQVGEV